MYRNSITSSLSAEFTCHVAFDEPYDPLFDDDQIFMKPQWHGHIALTSGEKGRMLLTRLPAAGRSHVQIPTP